MTKDVIKLFGGTVKVAKALGISHSAVSNWRVTGIPDANKWRLMKIAKERGISLSIEQLEMASSEKSAA